MASTTTIRVTVATRDLLSEQARVRNISVTALVADLAYQAERNEMFRRERELWLAEAGEPANGVELNDWDTTTADGLE